MIMSHQFFSLVRMKKYFPYFFILGVDTFLKHKVRSLFIKTINFAHSKISVLVLNLELICTIAQQTKGNIWFFIVSSLVNNLDFANCTSQKFASTSSSATFVYAPTLPWDMQRKKIGLALLGRLNEQGKSVFNG